MEEVQHKDIVNSLIGIKFMIYKKCYKLEIEI